MKRHITKFNGGNHLNSLVLGAMLRFEFEGRGEEVSLKKAIFGNVANIYDNLLITSGFIPFVSALALLVLIGFPWHFVTCLTTISILFFSISVLPLLAQYSGLRLGWHFGTRIEDLVFKVMSPSWSAPFMWGGSFIAGLLLLASTFGYNGEMVLDFHPEGVLVIILALAVKGRIHPYLVLCFAWLIGMTAMISASLTIG